MSFSWKWTTFSPSLTPPPCLVSPRPAKATSRSLPRERLSPKPTLRRKKHLFRDAALAHADLLQQIHKTLASKSDGSMPLQFFHDLLDEHFSEEDTEKQIETALNWGRYGEIFTYDPETDRLHLHHAGAPESAESKALH